MRSVAEHGRHEAEPLIPLSAPPCSIYLAGVWGLVGGLGGAEGEGRGGDLSQWVYACLICYAYAVRGVATPA